MWNKIKRISSEFEQKNVKSIIDIFVENVNSFCVNISQMSFQLSNQLYYERPTSQTVPFHE